MNNFCINCGNKLGKDDKYCTNCGTKIDNSDYHSVPDAWEKEMAKKELKRLIDGRLIYNMSFANKLFDNGLNLITDGKSIRQQLELEIDSGQIRSGDVESRIDQLIAEHKIRHEEEMARIDKVREDYQKLKKADEESLKEKKARTAKSNQMNQSSGGHCGLGCKHCYEEFFDGFGGITGDFDDEGYVEYYCHLGHPIVFGRYCEDYE